MNTEVSKTYYVYLIHESPVIDPYYCKVGYSADPLRRLSDLQAGNPRALRSWDEQRKPTEPFGFRFETEGAARNFEAKVLATLRGMGHGLRGDFDYRDHSSSEREWVADIHPEKLWILMAKLYAEALGLARG